ncbi:MAG: GIY-YIG nuclease family protein [Anaerolineales bacterium]
MKTAYVYIMGNKTGVLYVGMTNDLLRRVDEHKRKLFPGFSRKYSTDRLLYFEEFNHPLDALEAERIIKGWTRKKKLDLIRTVNPAFTDLSKELLEE